MAEKMANSIGRELRYFEYKFRKKQTSKKNKKGKSDGALPGGSQMAWSDGSRREDIHFETPNSEELKRAMPSNKGEEDLQIQVALAMSKEDETERHRKEESDQLRLQLALKESEKDVQLSPPKPAPPQQSLLDISLGGAAPSNDPWGAQPTTTANFDPFTGQPTTAPITGIAFDPFASQPPPTNVPIQTSLAPASGFGDTWGNQQAPAPPADPWGVTPQYSTPSTFPTSQNNSAWGNISTVPTSTMHTSQPTQNAAWGTVPASTMPTSQPQNGAWGSTVPASTMPTSQPVQNGAWGNISTVPASQPAQNGAWGNPDPFLSTQPGNFDPFTSNTPATSTFPTTEFETPPLFDPLKDFDTLHIGGNAPPSPIVLHKNYSTPSSSVARDIFPIQQILEPQTITTNGTINIEPQSDIKPQPTDKFLGANSDLVNLDSWQTYQVPYVTKPLGTTSHNPFANTGPSKSMNEMRNQQYAQPLFQ